MNSILTKTAAGSGTQFEHMVPIFPQDQIMLETNGGELATRMVDLFSPLVWGSGA